MLIECPDEALSDLTSQSNMEANGWTFNTTSSVGDNAGQDRDCGADTYHGHAFGAAVGAARTPLRGTGTARLLFGKCQGPGSVKVYLNGLLLSTATTNGIREKAEFTYYKGDVLEVLEFGGTILKLNEIKFYCTA